MAPAPTRACGSMTISSPTGTTRRGCTSGRPRRSSRLSLTPAAQSPMCPAPPASSAATTRIQDFNLISPVHIHQ
uniref:Uncharacterized protein n=1 Tax=Arundo donax TaxID=35708 RepID=A0A0A9E2T2_ARUDO